MKNSTPVILPIQSILMDMYSCTCISNNLYLVLYMNKQCMPGYMHIHENACLQVKHHDMSDNDYDKDNDVNNFFNEGGSCSAS